MKRTPICIALTLLAISQESISLPFPPDQVTAEAFGQQLTPDEVCSKFNTMVDRSNQWLQNNGFTNSVISKDLCSVVRVQTSYPTQKYFDIQDAERWEHSSWEYWLDEEVDIVEENAVILLSSKSGDVNRTRYMLYSNSSADLVKQEGSWNYTENIGSGHGTGDNRYLFTQTGQESTAKGIIKPTYFWRLWSGKWAYILSDTWHGSQFRSFMVDGSNSDLIVEATSRTRDFYSAVMDIENPTPEEMDRAMGEFLWRICVGGTGESDIRCLPGGADNATSFSTRDSFPNSDGADTGDIEISSSSSVSMGLSGNVGIDSDGPSAGLDLSVGQEFSTGIADNIKVMELDKMSMRNNLGANWTYRLNPVAIGGDLQPMVSLENAFNGVEDRVNNANAVFGEGSWKSLDMATQYDWAEENNSMNCIDGSEREMWFITAHDVTRGSITMRNNIIEREDITHNGGYMHNRAPLSGISQSQIIKVNTICDDGFRYHKRGMLNKSK